MTETVELERPLRCLGPTRAAGVSQRRAGGGSGARFAEGVNGTACGLSAVPDVGADGVSTPGRTGPSEVARAAGVAASEAARGRGQKDLVVLPARPRLCWSASHSVSRGFLGTPVAASRPLASRLLRGGRFVRRRFERSVCSAAAQHRLRVAGLRWQRARARWRALCCPGTRTLREARLTRSLRADAAGRRRARGMEVAGLHR